MNKWFKTSNRTYHFLIGLVCAIFSTIIGSAEVACAMEGKDCQSDPKNKGLKPWEWSYSRWDWLDWIATMLGGLIGQALQALLVWIILK